MLHETSWSIWILELPLHRRGTSRRRSTIRQSQGQIQIQTSWSQTHNTLHSSGPQINAFQESYASWPQTWKFDLQIRKQLGRMYHCWFRTCIILRRWIISLRQMWYSWICGSWSHQYQGHEDQIWPHLWHVQLGSHLPHPLAWSQCLPRKDIQWRPCSEQSQQYHFWWRRVSKTWPERFRFARKNVEEKPLLKNISCWCA